MAKDIKLFKFIPFNRFKDICTNLGAGVSARIGEYIASIEVIGLDTDRCNPAVTEYVVEAKIRNCLSYHSEIAYRSICKWKRNAPLSDLEQWYETTTKELNKAWAEYVRQTFLN